MAQLLATNVAGTLNCTALTSTSSLNVVTSTNTVTLNVSTSANITGLNAAGIVIANACPLSNTATRVATGLVGTHNVATLSTSSTTLANDNYLLLTFNETGWYAIDGMLLVCGNSGSNGFGGFQFDLGANSGAIANLNYVVTGYSNTYFTPSGVIVANNQQGYNVSNVAATNTAPSYFYFTGSAHVATGTWGLRWAQNVSSPNATVMMPGSYFKALKIG